MAYNLTNVTEANDILGVVIATNDLVNGSFSVMVMFSLWLVIFIATKRFSTTVSTFTASFICSIVSTLFLFAGFVVLQTYVIIMTILVISIFISVWWRN